jgi:two-component system nitrogen regulation response regulator GlnG
MLVNHYVRRFNRELARGIREVTPETMARLCDYPWPGNIRELQSALKQAILKATGPVLVPAFLPEKLLSAHEPAATAETSEVFARLEAVIRQGLERGSEDLYQDAHQQLDRFLVPLVLRATDGNQVQAARVLGISRQTLRFKIRELGLTITKSVSEDEGEGG